MQINNILKLLLLWLPVTVQAGDLSRAALDTAAYVSRYETALVDTLAEMVSYRTVAVEGVALEDNPQFTAFRHYIKATAESFGLEVRDHGEIIIVSLGEQAKRIGIVTHGDVQPADAGKWARDPFELDPYSEPGRLIGRGTEDDKAPIACALYAMKSIREKQVPLKRRIELIIYLAEESDWSALRSFIAENPMPDLNVTIDSGYPVVTAEKGYGSISFTIPRNAAAGIVSDKTPSKSEEFTITSFSGGAFASQVPEDGFAVINGAKEDLENLLTVLKQAANEHPAMHYSFNLNNGSLNIRARGKAAHSATPETGVNAVAYLADLLSVIPPGKFAKTPAALAVQFLYELVGTGYYGEKFGMLAYSHEFMGPMTLAVTLVTEDANGINININTRRPAGRTARELMQETQEVMAQWQEQHNIKLVNINSYFGEPLIVEDAPHVARLLDVFSHFTGIEDPQPISIGGSTNAKLLPNAVSFGPAMPGVTYTGHSEHEFITLEQLNLNLKMYTAMMIEMGNLE